MAVASPTSRVGSQYCHLIDIGPESIRRRRGQTDHDFELVVVDDASTNDCDDVTVESSVVGHNVCLDEGTTIIARLVSEEIVGPAGTVDDGTLEVALLGDKTVVLRERKALPVERTTIDTDRPRRLSMIRVGYESSDVTSIPGSQTPRHSFTTALGTWNARRRDRTEFLGHDPRSTEPAPASFGAEGHTRPKRGSVEEHRPLS